ncbi:1495_t:CDS:2, partial [Funneliformis geosporum]
MAIAPTATIANIAGCYPCIEAMYSNIYVKSNVAEIAAVRSKWIDQSISHNVFAQETSGKKLNDIYFAAWEKGLKTTYYLRTLGASQIEKSTLDA